MPFSYYSTNSNGYGYDNTASNNTTSYGETYDDTRIDPLAYKGESNLSSSYSDHSEEIYDEDAPDRFSTPLASVRAPNPMVSPALPTSEYDTTTNAPYSPAVIEDNYQNGYNDGMAYNRGYEEGIAAARRNQREDDPEHNPTGATEAHSTQGYGYSSMLLAHPVRDGTDVSTDPPEGTESKYQNQFGPAAPKAGNTFDDSYSHGGLPMNSGHMGGHGLSKTGVAAGAGSGKMGKGVGRQPGLASVNAGTGGIGLGGVGGGVARGSNIGPGYGGGISGMSKAGYMGGSAGHGNKPGTGGWKGAAKRVMRKVGEKSEKSGGNDAVGKTGRKYY